MGDPATEYALALTGRRRRSDGRRVAIPVQLPLAWVERGHQGPDDPRPRGERYQRSEWRMET